MWKNIFHIKFRVEKNNFTKIFEKKSKYFEKKSKFFIFKIFFMWKNIFHLKFRVEKNNSKKIFEKKSKYFRKKNSKNSKNYLMRKIIFFTNFLKISRDKIKI